MYVYIYIYICIYVYIYIYNEEKTPMFSNFAKISSKYADQVQTNRGKLVWCKQKTIFLVSYSHPMSLFKEVCSAPEVYLFRYSCVAKSHVSYNESCL